MMDSEVSWLTQSKTFVKSIKSSLNWFII